MQGRCVSAFNVISCGQKLWRRPAFAILLACKCFLLSHKLHSGPTAIEAGQREYASRRPQLLASPSKYSGLPAKYCLPATSIHPFLKRRKRYTHFEQPREPPSSCSQYQRLQARLPHPHQGRRKRQHYTGISTGPNSV